MPTCPGWGSKNQIRIRPSLITGQHKLLRDGDEFLEGRLRFVEDVLLHESVHQDRDERLHTPENSYKGHGPVFAGECNRIGEALGLRPVRPAKARGPHKDLPSCAEWPHNVRPREYYLGALADVEPKAVKEDEVEDESLTWPCPKDHHEAVPELIAHFGQEGMEYIFDEVAQFFARKQQPQAAVSPNGDETKAPEKKGGRKAKAKATVSSNRDESTPKPGRVEEIVTLNVSHELFLMHARQARRTPDVIEAMMNWFHVDEGKATELLDGKLDVINTLDGKFKIVSPKKDTAATPKRRGRPPKQKTAAKAKA